MFKSIISFVLFVLVVAFSLTFVSAQSRQSFAPVAPIAPGKNANMRLASEQEVNTIVVPAMAATAPRTAVNSASRDRNPLIAIDAEGDAYNKGVTATAFNLATIPAGSFFGTISDNARQFYVWRADSDIPMGYLWYNIENQRKLSYSEQGTVLEPKFIVLLPNGVIQQYTTSKNFGAVGIIKQLVTDGFAVNDSTGPIFVLYANVNRSAGVLIHIPDSYSFPVPKEAITVRNGIVQIDTSKIENVYLPTGDYRFTVVDSDGYSDNGFHVRLVSDQATNGNLKKRLQTLAEQTAR